MQRKNKILTFLLIITLFTTSFYQNQSITITTQSKTWITNTERTIKNLKNIAIFIEFSDSDTNVTHHLDDAESVNNAYKIYNSDQLFEMNTVNGIIQVPSFKKYYETESYGKLSITTDIFPKQNNIVNAYRDTHPIGYYLKYNDQNTIGYKNNEESLKRETELINNVLANTKNQIEQSGITANDLDTNNDGKIDAISFIVEGQKNLPSSISWQDLLWSHKRDNYGITQTILGKNITAYNFLYADDYTEAASLFSMNRGTYGTIMHEFGHTLGYMDLYRYGEPNSKPVGFYDIMGNTIGSNPQHLLTYFTSEYHPNTTWRNPIPEINKTTNNITLYKPKFIDPNEKRAIKIKTESNNKEYFIVEYHEKQNTYESYSADSSGIIVYRVNDNNKYQGNTGSSEYDHIYVFRPNEPSLGESKGDLSKATLNMSRPILGKTSNSTTFDNQTIFYSNGSNSGIQIEVTNETTESITFNVTFREFVGEGTQDKPYLINDTQTFLNLMTMNTKNKYYKLTDNLDFNNIDYPMIDFEGNLDGNNKTILNIKTNGSGIFNNIGNYNVPTKIENLNLENITVYSNKGNYLGGLANVAENITLNNIHIKSGTITNEGNSLNDITSTGGLVGNVSSTTTIENCSANTLVKANKNVGGLIGINQNAKIKNSFWEGTITGNETIGGIIGLQAITDNTYKLPENVYYYSENQNLLGVGGYAKNFHNLNVLNESSLSNGITHITVTPNIEIFTTSKINLPLTTKPNTSIPYSIEIENPNIIKYENNQIVALTPGSTNLYIDIKIGIETIRLTSNITVKTRDEIKTEEELLQYLGITKKSEYVTGFQLGTNIKDIQKNILNSTATLKHFTNANNVEITEGIIATGMKFTLLLNNQEYTYTIVVKGDVNGDGKIFATDYVKVKNHIMNKTNLSGAYLEAADINNDNKIYATDYVQIKNHIMGKNEIIQK